MPKLLRDVVVLPEAGSRWLAMNVCSRTSLGLDGESLGLLRQAEVEAEAELFRRQAGRSFNIWDTAVFSNADGLLADPTRYHREVADWQHHEVGVEDFLAACRKQFLLVDDEAEYAARFAPKGSLLDRKNFGNFHQQLGQELLLGRRENPEDWWLRQKFVNDLTAIDDTLYKAVQEYGIKAYFRETLRPGDSVVDLGCGIGCFSQVIAEAGAQVVGIDPNPDYIEHARKRMAPGAQFDVLPVGSPGGLDSIPDASADYVFMSDALLFYFVSPSPETQADIGVLLNDVRRILKPGGRFANCEPNYLFWLKPWLGEVERPFTIFSEYRDDFTYAVTPTLSRFLKAFAEHGFAVLRMEEFEPNPAYRKVDARAYNFAKRFPLWQLFEFMPLG